MPAYAGMTFYWRWTYETDIYAMASHRKQLRNGQDKPSQHASACGSQNDMSRAR
jgi:hypothetical protein